MNKIPMTFYVNISRLTAIIFMLLSCHLNAEIIIVKPGSELINGNLLKPFAASWSQYAKTEGSKVKKAQYHEQLKVDESSGEWLHIQKVTNSGGVIVTNTTLFDRAKLVPVSIHQTFENAPSQAPKSKTYIFDEYGYEVKTIFADDKVETKTVSTPTKMFNVANLGLVLAAITLEQGKTYRMPSSFPQYLDGQYWMDITVVKSITLTDAVSNKIPVWQLDVYWLNIKEGDEYPAGPEGSGGAYLISQNPEMSGAPVPAYINDSMEILQDGLSF